MTGVTLVVMGIVAWYQWPIPSAPSSAKVAADPRIRKDRLVKGNLLDLNLREFGHEANRNIDALDRAYFDLKKVDSNHESARKYGVLRR